MPLDRSVTYAGLPCPNSISTGQSGSGHVESTAEPITLTEILTITTLPLEYTSQSQQTCEIFLIISDLKSSPLQLQTSTVFFYCQSGTLLGLRYKLTFRVCIVKYRKFHNTPPSSIFHVYIIIMVIMLMRIKSNSNFFQLMVRWLLRWSSLHRTSTLCSFTHLTASCQALVYLTFTNVHMLISCGEVCV